MSDFSVSRIEKAVAHGFMERFEHLGNVGLGVWHWGLFHRERIVGAVSYGVPNFSHKRGWISDVAASSGLKIVQLCRGGTVPDAPRNSSSRIVAKANREMRDIHGDCLVVSYADVNYNEIGTIYQASNFVYCGMTRPKNQANYLLDGKLMSGWKVRKEYGTRDMKKLRKLHPRIEKYPLTPKHIYISVVAGRKKKNHVLTSIANRVEAFPKRETLGINDMDIPSLIKIREDGQNFAI